MYPFLIHLFEIQHGILSCNIAKTVQLFQCFSAKTQVAENIPVVKNLDLKI